MKNILFAFLMGLLMVACSESSNSVEPSPENDKITFASGTNLLPAFDVEGGTVSISFTASKSWTASLVNNRADGWCKVEPSSGSSGINSITIKVSPNEELDDKSAIVQIKSGNATETINVSQKQKNALTLTSNKYEVDAEGGSVEIEVKANVKYSYSVDEAAKEWIVYESSRTLTTSYLKFKISPNESLTTREGTITISDGVLSETVTIYQQGEKPSIIISQKDYTIDADADTIQVEVSSNVNVEIQMPDVNWIAENQSRAYSTNTYHFLVSANDTYDNRSAEIIFKNTENNLEEKVVINQIQRDAIVLAKNEYTLEKEASHLDFEVQTNVAFEVKVEVDWIKQVQSRGLESHSLYFDVAENTGDNEREGKIVISSGNIKQVIKVIQRGKAVDVEKIAEYVVEVSEKVAPLFMECETIEELATHLDEIKNMDGVADAWVTNTALFIETKGGFPLSWLYTPDVDAERTEIEPLLSAGSNNEVVVGRSVPKGEHNYMKDFKRVCILNQQADDESRDYLEKQYKALGQEFENAGFEVTYKDGKNINICFLRDSLTCYDIIHFITHGVYDKKNNHHWMASGECVYDAWESVVKMGKDGIKGYQIGSVKELRKGKPEEVKYLIFSEDFFKHSMQGQFEGSLFFTTACQSLMDTESFAKVFQERGVNVFWGYNETNYVGKMIGCQLYHLMLQGKTVQEAYDIVPKIDHNAHLKMILKNDAATNICIVHPEEPTDVAEAVDLGLSVLWASHNVGATKPEEYGDYYAWGETEEKEKYTVWNYKFYNMMTGEMTDLGEEISGTKYDVAKIKWGDGWRMPTTDEMLELTEECEWTDTICGGVKGKKVTGVNGNSIFFPAAGMGAPGSDTFKPGEFGLYWLGTLNETYLGGEYLYFEFGYPEWISYGASREYGQPVRPVKDK